MVLSLLIICSKTVTTRTWLSPLKNVVIFCPKILAVLKHHGKVFGGVFFDSFWQSEQESEEISALDALLAEIIIWRALVVHNCSWFQSLHPCSSPSTIRQQPIPANHHKQQQYAMWSMDEEAREGRTMKTGPNNARSIIWALGEFFLFLPIFQHTN